MPVMIGMTIPDRLPSAFWNPTHVPEARGPANICATAYRLSESEPDAAPAMHNRMPTERALCAKASPRIAAAASDCVDIIIQRRQIASDRPERVHQSEKWPKIKAKAP